MDCIGYLKRIVSVDSVFPNEKGLAFFLAGELERAGFDVELQRLSGSGERYNVLASRGGGRNTEPETGGGMPDAGGRPLLLYGHMDTVPPYGYEAEGRDPFSLEERGGKLYGLGAYDMKAGLAAIMDAVSRVRSGRALKVMFVSDEEADSRGCFEALRTGFADNAALALATEISDVHDISEKTRTITLGRRGRAQYEVHVPGRSFHAARAEEGISALSEAARLALEIDRMNGSLPEHPQLPRGHMFVRAFHSQSESLSLPDSARLVIDRHLVPPEDAESARADIEQRIRALYAGGIMGGAQGLSSTVRTVPRDVPYLMPYATPQDEPGVAELAGTVREVLGVDARYNYGLSVADENLLAMHGLAVASLGPIGGGEHSANEWVSKQSCIELSSVLRALIARK